VKIEISPYLKIWPHLVPQL